MATTIAGVRFTRTGRTYHAECLDCGESEDDIYIDSADDMRLAAGAHVDVCLARDERPLMEIMRTRRVS